MALITRLLAALRRDEDGQGLAEYALILALIAIVAIIALIFLGTQVIGHPQHRRCFRLTHADSRGRLLRPTPGGGAAASPVDKQHRPDVELVDTSETGRLGFRSDSSPGGGISLYRGGDL